MTRHFPTVPLHTCGPDGYCRACRIEDEIARACERIAERRAEYTEGDIIVDWRWDS